MRSWIVSACSAALVAASFGGPGPPPTRGEVREVVLNALDYKRNIYDFRAGARGSSRQIDEDVREYLGDVFFTGEEFVVLETSETSGTFADLGMEPKPDTEFSPFHALRLYRRSFQIERFPFGGRFEPYEGLNQDSFLHDNRRPVTRTRANLGHAYLLRLFHRTKVGEDRIFLLRILELTPGVKVVFLYRELENLRES